MGFPLVPKVVTVNGLERRNGRYFVYFAILGSVVGKLRQSD